MATINSRADRTGKLRHTATVRIKRNGKIVHRESATFSSKSAAIAWGKAREVELAKPGALDPRPDSPTLRRVIEDYLTDRAAVAELGRTKSQTLGFLARHEFAGLAIDRLDAPRIIGYVLDRRKGGAGPSTVMQEIVWLRVVLRYARSAWGMRVDMQAIEDAAETLRRERMIAPSRRRLRRPTDDELERIGERFRDLERRKDGIPGSLYRILWAAIYSARRLDELMSLRLADYDRNRWLVRDVKNPSGSEGNHKWMLVTPQFKRVIDACPAGERLFPFNARSVGSGWQREMKLLGIEDLHFHDLRHEACSRLAEDGWTIPQVQQVSLHDSWSSLQVYVQLQHRDGSRVEFT